MLSATDVAHRGFAKDRAIAGDDDEVEAFLIAATTVRMKPKGLSMQSGMLTDGHHVNSLCAVRLRQWPPSSSVNTSPRVTALNAAGRQASVAFGVWKKRVGQDIRSKPASSVCKWLTFLVLFCVRGIQEK